MKKKRRQKYGQADRKRLRDRHISRQRQIHGDRQRQAD